jgi:hypothetical protein
MVLAPCVAGAQVTPPIRPDSVATRDSAAADSARVARELARQLALTDTLRTPLARAEVPSPPSVASTLTWDRDALWATGALTLGELVDRVPGITAYRSGWIAAPELAAYLGRFGRVRVFLDGMELDGLNARLGGLADLSAIDMWQLQDATIEPAAGEVRVHLRSWHVTSTVPRTRIDINTGDLQTNVFRGFYGRRFPTGHALQLGGSHYSTVDRRTAEEGDQTSFWGRVGWASGKWSVDGSFLRSGRKYTERQLAQVADTIPTLDGGPGNRIQPVVHHPQPARHPCRFHPGTWGRQPWGIADGPRHAHGQQRHDAERSPVRPDRRSGSRCVATLRGGEAPSITW